MFELNVVKTGYMLIFLIQKIQNNKKESISRRSLPFLQCKMDEFPPPPYQ